MDVERGETTSEESIANLEYEARGIKLCGVRINKWMDG